MKSSEKELIRILLNNLVDNNLDLSITIEDNGREYTASFKKDDVLFDSNKISKVKELIVDSMDIKLIPSSARLLIRLLSIKNYKPPIESYSTMKTLKMDLSMFVSLLFREKMKRASLLRFRSLLGEL